jgi:hypothetical protein
VYCKDIKHATFNHDSIKVFITVITVIQASYSHYSIPVFYFNTTLSSLLIALRCIGLLIKKIQVNVEKLGGFST